MEQQWLFPQQPMGVDNPHEGDIVAAAKNRLMGLNQQRRPYSGTSLDLFQFTYDPARPWSRGSIFRANALSDLSFEDGIQAADGTKQSEAAFRVVEANRLSEVENMMARSLRLNHPGILKPSVGGYNTQIERVVWGFLVPDGVPIVSLGDWLESRRQNASTFIPPEVQDLLRTAYGAIVTIWHERCTSDSLANVGSYYMVDNKIKIDPLCIRERNGGENNEMLPRRAFGLMISQCIQTVWNDPELEDFIQLLRSPEACVLDILEAPVLLLPARRELMYFEYDTFRPCDDQQEWLDRNACPQDGWKVIAGNMDPILKTIIDLQKNNDESGVGFSTDFKGALHFASVVTAHYDQHVQEADKGKATVKNRVDLLLKQALPRLLSKCYNSSYLW